MILEGAKFRKKQKETQKLVKPWTSLSEDAVVVKYLLWLGGLWTNSRKWDQLKADEYTEATSRAASCRKLGNILGNITALLLYSSALAWTVTVSHCPKMGTWKLATIPQNCSLFFFHYYWQTKTIPPHFIKGLWITHFILCLSYLYLKLIIH